MARKSSQTGSDERSSNPREDRLKTALKANLAKRKAQARARAAEADVSEANQDKPAKAP
ncbi:hypothetical protein V8J82_01685 [Gymnodinialimonas sp. 2305UL16-5]|uniref:hypothetical protein n=1 Tax=Gymnodinialimonas mytili TaxID=3126503 RepID=UPI00309E8175